MLNPKPAFSVQTYRNLFGRIPEKFSQLTINIYDDMSHIATICTSNNLPGKYSFILKSDLLSFLQVL